MQWNVKVDKEKCTGCGECVENCPGDVFELIDSCSEPVNMEGNCSQGTGSFRDQPGLRMPNTLYQSACENLRHPAISYKYRDKSGQVAYSMSTYHGRMPWFPYL